MITNTLLRGMFPALSNSEAFVAPLTRTCAKFGIDSKLRLAAFIAQCGHESGGFRFLSENLNYSSDALLRVFGKYFDAKTAAEYARKPERIANRVYANRMGNGPETSGDGWKFRGKGIIQLTGKDNVSRFAASVGMTVDEASAYLETIEGACMGAGWFWSVNNLNALADKGDMRTLTRRINGGEHGLEDRLAQYAKVKKLLGI
jgi:putative chitinase